MSSEATSGRASRITAAIQRVSPRGKQYLVLTVVFGVFMALVGGSVAMVDTGPALPKARKSQLPTKNIAAPGTQVDPKDVWMSESSTQMQGMNDAMREMERRMKQMEEDKSKAAKTAEAGKSQEPAKSILPDLPPIRKAAQKTSAELPALPLPSAYPAEQSPPKKPGIAVVTVSTAPTPELESEKEKATSKVYIPATSFMRVALLGGLDAPTGGQAQNNPWPVLMRVQDNAFLPNKYRAAVKECFLLGAGFGEISSERVSIKIETFSCVLNNGEVVDTSAKGYVVGEDGKAGMRGRLVTKQGQVLANALTMGVVSGIGSGFQQSATQYNQTAFGTTSQVDPSKTFTAGVGAGVGKALDRLSQYYIKLAEKMFPIIEIDAGRVVEVVLTKGLTLGVATPGADDEFSDIWIRGRRSLNKPLNPYD